MPRFFKYLAPGVLVLAMAISAAAQQPAVQPAAARLPVPDADSQAAAMKLVQEMYKDDLAKAKKPEDQSVLAKTVLQTGIDLANDPAGKYALFCEARDIAVDAVDSTTALAAIDAMNKAYQIDAPALKSQILARLIRDARTPEQFQALAEVIGPLIDQATAADDYDAAGRLADLELGAARRADDKSLVEAAAAQVQQIEAIKPSFAPVKRALATLAANPNDPDANLAMGKFKCFVKNDWDRGLPMLAIGSDAALKDLAQKELANPTDMNHWLELGDGWWDLAQKENGPTQKQMQRRAVKWYEQADPVLTGLTKAKIDGRLQQFQKLAANEPNPAAINLLKLINPATDMLAGQWVARDGALISDMGAISRMRLPYKPPEEYDFHTEFEIDRPPGGQFIAITQMITAGGRTFDLAMIGTTMPYDSAAFEGCGGATVINPTNKTLIKMPQLVKGQRYSSVIKVRKGLIEFYLDGKLLISHPTDYSEFNTYRLWDVGQGMMGLGSFQCRVGFLVAEVIPFQGKDDPSPPQP